MVLRDIRLEKALEALYDDIVQTVSIGNRKRCPVLLKMAMVFSQMKHETSGRIARDFGIVRGGRSEGEEFRGRCAKARRGICRLT